MVDHFEGDVTVLGGTAQQEAVGESFHQEVFESICGRHRPDGHHLPVIAILEPEPNNPHDANAVAVQVDGHTVGHLPRAMAARLQGPLIDLQVRMGTPIGCRARIVGGWDMNDGSRANFGIHLFFDPAQLENDAGR